MSAVDAAEVYEFEVIRIPKSKAGDDINIPSVYLDDIILAEIGGLRDGKIEGEDLMDELENAKVPRIMV